MSNYAILLHVKIVFLKRTIVDLLNALSFDNHIDYEEKRMCDEKAVFSTAADELYACDREGKTLCKGRIENGCFTGYKSTYEYEGEYVAGKRHGRGIEYCMSIYDVDSWYEKVYGKMINLLREELMVF